MKLLPLVLKNADQYQKLVKLFVDRLLDMDLQGFIYQKLNSLPRFAGFVGLVELVASKYNFF